MNADHNFSLDGLEIPAYQGIFVFSQGRLVYHNLRAAEILGTGEEKLGGLPRRVFLSKIAPQDRARTQQSYRQALQGRPASLLEHVDFLRADGSRYTVDLLVQPAVYRGDPAVLVNLLDLSLWKEMQEQQRKETALMQNLLGALAGALSTSANLSQTLELVLVNLRSLVPYDQARLFLLDRSTQAMMEAGGSEEHARAVFGAQDPLVRELFYRRRAMIVADVQSDARFRAWTEMESVRGWMGVPLLMGDEKIGFLSLGSLTAGAYTPADGELAQSFADQVARILERSWLHEQSRRQREELEVISKITYALGEVQSQETLYPALIEQIGRAYGAVRGIFLFPEKAGAGLVVRYSLDPTLTGIFVPPDDHWIWPVMYTGASQAILDVSSFLQDHPQQLYRLLLDESRAAAITPLKAQGEVFGVLLLLFDEPNLLLAENSHLLETIATTAGFFLNRGLFLEVTEKQLNLRTKHLTALYDINQAAGKSIPFIDMLDQMLAITTGVMGSKAGVILLLDEHGRSLSLASDFDLPGATAAALRSIPLEDEFWRSLIASSEPLVVPNLAEETRLPADLRSLAAGGLSASILAPIRSIDKALGVIWIFNESILAYSIDDITLLMNITDQIGSAVERAYLSRQASHAAVVEERQRLARELHDSVTQMLYSQVLFTGAGLRVLEQGNLEQLRYTLERLNLGALQALKEMRLMLYELRPSEQLADGLVTALQRRLDAVEKRSGINAVLEVQGDLSIDDEVEMALYRITEEALNNTLKHSLAHNVWVKLRQDARRLVLEVVDDGLGFVPEEQRERGGMGLATMSERAAALGGVLDIHSQEGAGTRLSVTIQLEK